VDHDFVTVFFSNLWPECVQIGECAMIQSFSGTELVVRRGSEQIFDIFERLFFPFHDFLGVRKSSAFLFLVTRA